MPEVKKSYRGWADMAGIGVSLACAVYCIVLPIILTTLPLFGMEVLRNIFFETAAVVLSAAIGSWALLRGFRKYHRRAMPVRIFVLSMPLLAIANFYAGSAEIILKLIAIPGIITSHVLNWRHSHQHQPPQPPAQGQRMATCYFYFALAHAHPATARL